MLTQQKYNTQLPSKVVKNNSQPKHQMPEKTGLLRLQHSGQMIINELLIRVKDFNRCKTREWEKLNSANARHTLHLKVSVKPTNPISAHPEDYFFPDTYLCAFSPFFLEEELLLKLIIGIILVPRLQELKPRKREGDESFNKTRSLAVTPLGSDGPHLLL